MASRFPRQQHQQNSLSTCVAVFVCLLSMATVVTRTEAFSVKRTSLRFHPCHSYREHQRTSKVLLLAKRNKKRNNLATIMTGGDDVATTVPKRTKKKSKTTTTVAISPDLQKFMASKEEEQPPATVDATFKKKKTISSSQRRVRTQTQTQQQDQERSIFVQSLVTNLTDAIVNKTVAHPWDAVQDALQQVSSTTQTTRNSFLSQPHKDPLDYRLVWISSDKVLCEFGSALHSKVPLARIQEVFLTLGGGGSNKRRRVVQLTEVLRILGPFPNVKNVLSGTSTCSTSTGQQQWNVVWDSLIDGTGKEQLAQGTITKSFAATIVYADEHWMVLKMDTTGDDLQKSKKQRDDSDGHIVLVRDFTMESTLEKLRVL